MGAVGFVVSPVAALWAQGCWGGAGNEGGGSNPSRGRGPGLPGEGPSPGAPSFPCHPTALPQAILAPPLVPLSPWEGAGIISLLSPMKK
jgi:hypothetical protein